jgi:hypothetical protein
MLIDEQQVCGATKKVLSISTNVDVVVAIVVDINYTYASGPDIGH